MLLDLGRQSFSELSRLESGSADNSRDLDVPELPCGCQNESATASFDGDNQCPATCVAGGLGFF